MVNIMEAVIRIDMVIEHGNHDGFHVFFVNKSGRVVDIIHEAITAEAVGGMKWIRQKPYINVRNSSGTL